MKKMHTQSPSLRKFPSQIITTIFLTLLLALLDGVTCQDPVKPTTTTNRTTEIPHHDFNVDNLKNFECYYCIGRDFGDCYNAKPKSCGFIGLDDTEYYCSITVVKPKPRDNYRDNYRDNEYENHRRGSYHDRNRQYGNNYDNYEVNEPYVDGKDCKPGKKGQGKPKCELKKDTRRHTCYSSGPLSNGGSFCQCDAAPNRIMGDGVVVILGVFGTLFYAYMKFM